MPILIDLNYNKNARITNTSGVIWVASDSIIPGESADVRNILLSLNGVAAEHYWNAEIASFSSPSYGIDNEHGGYIGLTFGSILLSPDAFADNWPPPRNSTMNVRYVALANTEADPILIFDGEISLVSYDSESATYTLNEKQYPQNLLTLGPDYNGNVVPYPRAFGRVNFVEPLRLADNGISQPTYHLGGIGTDSFSVHIGSFSTAAAGTKTTVLLEGTHPWSNGTTVTIIGTTTYDGDRVIESVTSTSFVIPVAFPTEGTEKLPIYASAFTAGDFIVCDNGQPLTIGTGVIINGDGTFSLSSLNHGTITISGTAAQTTLTEVIDWATTRLGVGSFIDTYARAVSPEVGYWANSQQTLITFMSSICAFFTHYFYIRSDLLYLGDMLIDAGTETLDEFDYFSAQYSAMDPIKQIISRWTTYESYEGFTDGVKTSQEVKEIKNVAVASAYEVSFGTATSTESFKLVDTTATFVTDEIGVGFVVQNLTNDTSTTVFRIMSETTLELVDDIFTSGDEYVVGQAFSYGQELDIVPYHENKSNVLAALQNILRVRNMDKAEIAIPMVGMPVPGKKITFSDTQMVLDMETWIRIRDITFNFEDEEVVLSGEGVISS